MAQDGFIKLHRQITEWEWYDNANMLCVFVHMLLRACYKEYKWHGITLQPGQLVIGRKEFAEECGISEQVLRTSITKLKSTNEITIESTKQGSFITIVKWRDYQSLDDESNQQINQQINHKLTNDQPTINQQLTTREESKEREEGKEGKEDIGVGRKTPRTAPFKPPSLEEVQAYCQERQNGIDAQRFVDFYASKGWRIGSNPMKDWKAAVRTWEAKDKERGYGPQGNYSGSAKQGQRSAQEDAADRPRLANVTVL